MLLRFFLIPIYIHVELWIHPGYSVLVWGSRFKYFRIYKYTILKCLHSNLTNCIQTFEGRWLYWLLIILKLTMCNLAWKIVFWLYLNNFAIFFSITIFRAFPTRIPGHSGKNPYELCCVILKDRINAFKLYDALCISSRNISGKKISKKLLLKHCK